MKSGWRYLPIRFKRGVCQQAKIARNLAVLPSVSKNIDADSFVVVQILSSASLHTLLVDEKGFDALGVRE
jgi:hypothetical protein